MTLDEVFQVLRAWDAVLLVGGGALHFICAEPLALDDPLRAGIAEHRSYLVELFTFAPGGRCVFEDCYHLLAVGDRVACVEHRRRLDQISTRTQDVLEVP